MKFEQKLAFELKAVESKQAAQAKSNAWHSKINDQNSRLQSLPEQSQTLIAYSAPVTKFAHLKELVDSPSVQWNSNT